MNIVSIISQVGILIGGIGGLEFFKWIRNRKADKRKALADADKAEAGADREEVSVYKDKADYADKIIKQADERVAQALADKERAITERDAAYVEAKNQRKSKQEWREKYFEEQKGHHATQLNLRDVQGKLNEAEWHRCEVNGCKDRVPPRTRSKE